MYISLLQDGLDPFYPLINLPNGERTVKEILRDTITQTATVFITRVNAEPIKNMGAFWRKVSRGYLREHYQNLDFDLKTELHKAAITNQLGLPSFLGKQ